MKYQSGAVSGPITSPIPAGRVGWSAISAIAMSAMVVAWHRPGRYTGTTG